MVATSFALSGMGCALPGALLPALLVSWHWNDSHAGNMFFVITAASAIAPLMARPMLRVSVVLGLLFSATALTAWAIGRTPHLVAAAAFGLGLGLIMTGASLQMVRGRRDGARVLARLNVLWSFGAVGCPFLVVHALRTGSTTRVLFFIASVFTVVALLAWALNERTSTLDSNQVSTKRIPAPWRWTAAAALATGIEASSGAWLTAFAQRTGHRLNAVVMSSACFWAGMLVSRLFWARRSEHLPAWCSLRALSFLILLSVIVILIAPHNVMFPLAAFAMGLGLGPLYPEFLGRTLALGDHTVIFFAAGAASAAMPYLTGKVSTVVNSLAAGWGLTLLAAVLLVALAWRTDSETAAPVTR